MRIQHEHGLATSIQLFTTHMISKVTLVAGHITAASINENGQHVDEQYLPSFLMLVTQHLVSVLQLLEAYISLF